MNVTKQLYQWDTGQKLTECTGLYVDFPIGEDIYRVETADGTCIIPDELLQKSSVHKIYECMADNTLREFVFNVKSRPKPPDYVYTPTERLTFEGLVQRVDDAVADIVRRADSGEFDGYTPVKGTDYFTTAEIQQIQNEVSSGAIGEFKSVVDTETETFNTNAESKLTTYNENDVAKTGAYNTNASNKVTEYNSNAENKTAEFDTHTEQIQADISELKSDLSTVLTELGMATTKTLDSVAYGGKTYRDIFATNNLIPQGDFENGLDWITTSTNNPSITDEAYTSKAHSLKCFGTSSVQIRKDITVSSPIEIAVLANVRVDRYASGGGAGFVVGENTLINRVTSGFETLYYRRVLNGTSSVFVGTASAANCDAYIDDFVLINLTSLFGKASNFPTQAELTQLYDEWIAIKNSDVSRFDMIEEEITGMKTNITGMNEKLDRFDTKPIFVGAVMGATSGANRFAAMRQLYAVAQKVIDDPTYQASDSDLTYAAEGAVCVLPQHSAGMYQKYPFNILYSKNGTTQAIPASTTKVMTLVTGLDYLSDMYERVVIVSEDIQDGASSILSVGDIVTITDLMYGMLLPSSNTCAMAFARVAGEKILKSQNGEGTYTATECQNAFVSAMATKATNLGMTSSTFVSPSGRSESNQTTVIDMLKFTIEACSYPIIEKIWNKKSYTIAVKGSNARNVDIVTTVADAGLESLYYIFGGKTGNLSLTQSSIALVMVAQAN